MPFPSFIFDWIEVGGFLHSGGRVIAPCDADDTSAAYFANTPLGYRGCGAFHCVIRSRKTSSLISTSSTAG